jgi:predicted tellurium resistance membrane protein TerC
VKENIVEYMIALLALSAMEIVLGIDNVVFIAILTSRLPADRQQSARRLGLALALVMRILLLLSLTYILRMTNPIFHLSAVIPLEWLPKEWLAEHVDAVSIKDLILLTGGLFLIWKSTHEIHAKLETPSEGKPTSRPVSFGAVLFQIALMDIIFSLDSVITAVGMVKNDRYGLAVMVTAVIIAVIVMLIFSETISRFVERHPTLKMLALSFLILIGVMLVAEGIGTHFNKGYIYFAMAFSLVMEFLNLRVRHVAQGSAIVN